MNLEANAVLDSVRPTLSATLHRMMKQAEIPETLALRLERWATEHGMSFEAAVELAVLMRWEMSHSASESSSVGLSVLQPPLPDA